MKSIYEQLRYLLSPKSAVIVGASADYSKFTGRTVKYVLKHRYPGKLYAVNPARTEVSGIPCFSSVKDLPEAVDTAFIQIAAKGVPGVIEQCIEKKIKSIIIHAAGLGEGGEEGKKTQDRIKAQTREAGIRVVGPNCAGIVNMTESIILSPVICYEIDDIPKGRIGLISQSGGLTGAYVSRAADRGIGFSYVISTGNEMDLGVSEFAQYLLQDKNTDAIAIFLEALRDVEIFREVAVEALKIGKPILVLKVGRTAVGAKAAASHTGALTGDDTIYDAFFKQYGITRVETLEDLFEVSALFCKTKPPTGRNVGVITTTGGGATIMVEAAAQAGLQFPLPSESSIALATEFLPSFAAKSNPMDVTMSGTGGGFKKGLEVLLKDDTFDMIVGVVGTSSQFAPELGVQPIVDVYKDAKKPLVAFCNPNAAEALRLFEKNGIPSFRTPESCGRSLGYLVKYGEALESYNRKKDQRQTTNPASSSAKEAKKFLVNAGRILNEYDSKLVLSAYGISVTKEKLAGNVEDAKNAAKEIGYPIAMKVMSADIPHKTEAGVIKLGVQSEKELEAFYGEILEKAKKFKADVKIDGVLIQEMAEKGVELIIGMKRDAGFGPVIMFGLGGIFVEVFKDVSFRIPPLSLPDAQEMIAEIKGSKLLQGYRGAEKMDVDAIASALMSVASLSLDLGKEIQELDINPLIVYPRRKGIKVVDALVCR
ncbi:MAG: acetate--CoA ligase family protein [Deltaproteobacteria bacterium]|nr:acetate--CoA ligase family protein [Deltaproteobacteria bacterium]